MQGGKKDIFKTGTIFRIMNSKIVKKIAGELHLTETSVANTLELLDQGCNIPYIAR